MPNMDELSPIETSAYWAGIFKDALESTKLVEIVESEHALNQIHLSGRVRSENEGKIVHGPISKMLDVVGPRGGFFGKAYFKRKDQLRYAWVFSLASDDLEGLIKRILEALEEFIEVAPKIDIMESPLLGPSTPMGEVSAGKPGPGKRGAVPLRSGG